LKEVVLLTRSPPPDGWPKGKYKIEVLILMDDSGRGKSESRKRFPKLISAEIFVFFENEARPSARLKWAVVGFCCCRLLFWPGTKPDRRISHSGRGRSFQKFVPARLEEIEEQVTGNLNGDSVPHYAEGASL
jgi:hypothetical protein